MVMLDRSLGVNMSGGATILSTMNRNRRILFISIFLCLHQYTKVQALVGGLLTCKSKRIINSCDRKYHHASRPKNGVNSIRTTTSKRLGSDEYDEFIDNNDASVHHFPQINVAATAAALTLFIAALPNNALASTLSENYESSSKTANKSVLEYSPSSNMVSSSAVPPTSQPMTMNQIFQKASKKAVSGGKAGASAAVVQVCSLMWLRTAMNYQYRYGGNLKSSLKELYTEGGIPRLYQGLPFALVQGPLTRFGDTAANVGVLVLLESFAWSSGLPLPIRSACGSLTAGLWRIFLMPVDSSKTVMQVEGKDGLTRLWTDVQNTGPSPLYRGSLVRLLLRRIVYFNAYLCPRLNRSPCLNECCKHKKRHLLLPHLPGTTHGF